MPLNVKEKFMDAEKGLAEIVVPSMVFAEMAYLSERGRIDANLSDAKKYLDKYPFIFERAVTFSTLKHAFEIDDIPELHDRLIAAAAKELDIPILTNDPDMYDSKTVKIIWKA